LKYSAVPQPGLDRALAARLEAAHGWVVENYVSELRERRPEVGAAALSVAGGNAFFAGESPFSFAVNVGMNGAVSGGELDLIEEFYASRGVPVRVDITPATDASLMRLAQERDYRVSDVTSVLAIATADADFGPQANGIALRWAHAEDCEVWVETIARNLYVSDPGEKRRRNMACMFHAPCALNLIAEMDGQVAGVAGCQIPHHAKGLAAIYGSCTVPEFRRLGVHGEMLRLRVETARAAGCDMVMATALPGSDSERNLERCGFEVCYVKKTWVKAQ
jgi:ribosomal protein S18 acetylase RimI-like enzyme